MVRHITCSPLSCSRSHAVRMRRKAASYRNSGTHKHRGAHTHSDCWPYNNVRAHCSRSARFGGAGYQGARNRGAGNHRSGVNAYTNGDSVPDAHAHSDSLIRADHGPDPRADAHTRAYAHTHGEVDSHAHTDPYANSGTYTTTVAKAEVQLERRDTSWRVRLGRSRS